MWLSNGYLTHNLQILDFGKTVLRRPMWLSHLPQLKTYGHFRTPYSKQYGKLEYEIRAYDMMMLAGYKNSAGVIKMN